MEEAKTKSVGSELIIHIFHILIQVIAYVNHKMQEFKKMDVGCQVHLVAN